MKSPLIILFIIFNLLAINLVSANSQYDEEIAPSHLLKTHVDATQAMCADESSCDHCCHISAHMTGVISQVIQITTFNTFTTHISLNESFYSLTLDPPVQPPQA